MFFRFTTSVSLIALLAALSVTAQADHGPGTSGSGVTTQTAETLKKKQWSATVHLDWTQFDSVNEDEIIELDHFDFLNRSYLTTLGVSYGVTDNFQISLGFGYYITEGARQIAHSHSHDAEPVEETRSPAKARKESIRRPVHANHGGGGKHPTAPRPQPKPNEPADEEPIEEEDPNELASFDGDGWTDLWLTGKYRLYHGPAGQFAVLGGIKFPTGDAEIYNSAGLRVERGSAASTGAWDGMLGAAYTIALTPSIAMDASAQFTWRGQKGGFRLGNRFDAGVAAGWRVLGAADRYPHLALLGEVSVRHIERSTEKGWKLTDTGGTTLFVSPGVRVAFNHHAAWTAAFHLPAVQSLNGNQVETEYQLSTSFSFAF